MNLLDPVANCKMVTVASSFSAGKTSLTLTTGGQSSLPNPGSVGAYNLVLFNSTDYTSPHLDPYFEIVRYTTQGSGEVINITEAQESTTARSSIVGKTYVLWFSLTAKMITDIDTYLPIFRTNEANLTAGSNDITFSTTMPDANYVVTTWRCRNAAGDVIFLPEPTKAATKLTVVAPETCTVTYRVDKIR